MHRDTRGCIGVWFGYIGMYLRRWVYGHVAYEARQVATSGFP